MPGFQAIHAWAGVANVRRPHLDPLAIYLFGGTSLGVSYRYTCSGQHDNPGLFVVVMVYKLFLVCKF